MAKNGGSAQSADHLIQVAGFLRQADKFVRERNYAFALEQIAKARAKDPLNSYAEAYEQRVRLLLSALNEKKQSGTRQNCVGSTTPQSYSHHFESIANLAIHEANRTASLSSTEEKLGERQTSVQVDSHGGKKEKPDSVGSRFASQLQSTLEFEAKSRTNLLFHGIDLANANGTPTGAIHDLEDRSRSLHPPWAPVAINPNLSHKGKNDTAAKEPDAIVRSVRYAEQLLRERRLDEAMNTLGSAKALDPLNEAVLTLEHGIHSALKQDYEVRLRLRQEMDKREAWDREMKENAVQEYLQKAIQFAGSRCFADALKSIVAGYDVDPFNPALGSCERLIHFLLNQEARKSKLASTVNDHEARIPQDRSQPESDKSDMRQPSIGEMSEHSLESKDVRQRILKCLDKAQSYLDEDRFSESLSQVVFAMIALDSELRVNHPAADTSSEPPLAQDEIAFSQHTEISSNQESDEISARIHRCLAKARQYADNGDYDCSLDEILSALSFDSSGGHSGALEHEIVEKYIEYSRMGQTTQPNLSETDPGMSNPDTSVSITQLQGIEDCTNSESQQETSAILTAQDRNNRIRSHLVQALGHLKQMQLEEATIESHKAMKLDESRKDIQFFHDTVANLMRRAKVQPSLNALSERFRRVKEFARTLIYNICCRDLILGIDHALVVFPSNDILNSRRLEVLQLLQKSSQTLAEIQRSDWINADVSGESQLGAKKLGRRTLNQIGLTFSEELDSEENEQEGLLEDNRLNDNNTLHGHVATRRFS